MKRRIVVYDVFFPIWAQLLVPRVLLSVLVINYVVNALVVKGALHVMTIRHTFRELCRYAAWATVLGLAADFCGLFVYELVGAGPVTTAAGPLIRIIVVAAPLIFGANYVLARRLLELPTRKSVILAVVMAVLTSPWTVLLERTRLL